LRCISVYTGDYDRFSDLVDDILRMPPGENEEKLLDGIVIADSGETDAGYVDRLMRKPDVAVLKEKGRGITILQHGGVFEIFLPDSENVVH